ncbi:MAG: hypothetical protein HZB98_04835 [Bacteroidia bacterium]|nr:hypothetical protein [Bacteroidia bacterium]
MNHYRLISFLLLPLLAAGCSNGSREIVVCGDDKVLIIDKSESDTTNVKVTWQWKVSDAADLPAEYQKYLVPTDECKPVDYNSKILITSSGGGVVLIDRQTKKPVFHAHVPNAHSAELLPGNRIVVALSTADGGNCIQLFNISEPDEVVFTDSLYSGHGVVWMDKTKQLFALGYDELRSYSLRDWDKENPRLKLEKRWKLPDDSGHELSKVNDNTLLLSTHHSVWLFNTGNGKFTPFRLLEGVENVKSANYDDATGELIFTKGEISWWTHNVYCKNPDKVIILPDIKIYKVRVIYPR